MGREKSTVNRREALQRISIFGIGTVVAACGGGNDDPARTATPTSAPTLAPSATASAAPSATSVPTSTVAPANTATPTALSNTSTPTAAPSQTPTAPPTASATVPATATGTLAPSCILTPQQVLGPFFIDVGLARSDVREDRQGVALRLGLQLVDADGCTPIRDAVVNIWHTDARGAYSGFPNQPGGIDTTGETYLRGFQVTGADGRVEFLTIFPGWYTGRAVHIHVRIHLDATTVLVTQLYFDDAIASAVFTQPPYAARGEPDTTNEEDAIIGDNLDELLVPLTTTDEGYAGAIVLGVAR